MQHCSNTCIHRYLERMTNALTMKAGQEGKLLSAAKDVEARRNEAKLQLMSLAPKVRVADSLKMNLNSKVCISDIAMVCATSAAIVCSVGKAGEQQVQR